MWSLLAYMLLVASVGVELVSAGGRITVHVDSFDNQFNQLQNGLCCGTSGRIAIASSPCPQCNTELLVCLKPFSQALDTSSLKNMTACPYGTGVSSLSESNDVHVPFDISWPGFFVAAIEARHQLPNGSSQTIFQTLSPISLNAQGNSRLIKADLSADSGMSMTYRVSMTCDAHRFGSDCSKYCEPQESQRGHYTCDQYGNKLCRAGWTGSRCLTPQCGQGCDQGTCVAPDTCRCHDGYNGTSCSQCIPHEGCGEHGYCTEPYNCVCEERWGGLLCNVDLDYCHHVKPCLNGGICHPGKPCAPGEACEYTCDCPSGFAGPDCAQLVPIVQSSCASSPCLNGGSCYPTTPTSASHPGYFCMCPDNSQFTGPNCETPVNSPLSLPNTYDVERAPSSFAQSCFYEGRFYSEEQHWSTKDCRQCDCKQGITVCTEAVCSADNCLASFNRGDDTCPFDQVCQPISQSPSRCLHAPCTTVVKGLCKPPQLLSIPLSDCNGVDDRETCVQLRLRLNMELVKMATTVDDVCHSILMVLLTNRLKQYNVYCTKSATDIVKVIMVSTRLDYRLHDIPDVIVSLLHHNQTVFPHLQSVIDASVEGRQTIVQSTTSQSPTVESEHGTSWIIYVVIIALSAVSISFCILIILGLKHHLAKKSNKSSPAQVQVPHLQSRGRKFDSANNKASDKNCDSDKQLPNPMIDDVEYATIDDCQYQSRDGNLYMDHHVVSVGRVSQQSSLSTNCQSVTSLSPTSPVSHEPYYSPNNVMSQNHHNQLLDQQRSVRQSSSPSALRVKHHVDSYIITECEASV